MRLMTKPNCYNDNGKMNKEDHTLVIDVIKEKGTRVQPRRGLK